MSERRRPFRVAPASADADTFWFWDASHFPGPVTPAAEFVDLPAMAAGFAAAARELRRAVAGEHVRVERGFVYFGVTLPRSAEELAEREARYQRTVDPLVGGALVDWRKRLEPRAESINDDLRALSRAIRSPASAVEAIEVAGHLRAEQWHIHDRALVPAMEAVARFQATYAERLGGVLAVQRLLQGFPNRATAAAEALDRFAESVRARPSLADALRRGRRPAARTREGAWFQRELAAFLETYGQRSEGWDAGTPTWAENPRPVLAAVRERLRREATDPGFARRRGAESREQAVAQATAALPPESRAGFLAALTAAQAYPVVSEDHNAVIDQQGMAALRAVLLAAGRALVARGTLTRAEDIIWLTPEEVAGAARGSAAVAPLAGRRRARHRRRRLLSPPRTLGGGLPPWAAANPTLLDFFGLGAEPVSAPGELHGTPASRGVATGRACVVNDLTAIDRLESGDILVCPMTSPAWTPWLSLIGGAVVESGGVLSHTAVLAREYGVPCVTGVRDATRRIPHGATVRVDGTHGAVTWLEAGRAG